MQAAPDVFEGRPQELSEICRGPQGFRRKDAREVTAQDALIEYGAATLVRFLLDVGRFGGLQCCVWMISLAQVGKVGR